MSKALPLSIRIPSPCSQPWEEMEARESGRFCSHCQKTVVDFTGWTDAALYRFFSENKGKVCGRFLSTQMARPMGIPYQPHSRLYHLVVSFGFTLLVVNGLDSYAQNKPPKVQRQAATKTSHTRDSAVAAPVSIPLLPVDQPAFRKPVVETVERNVTVVTGEPEISTPPTPATPPAHHLRRKQKAPKR